MDDLTDVHRTIAFRLADSIRIDRDRVSVRTGDDGAMEILLDGKPWDPEGLRQAARNAVTKIRSERFSRIINSTEGRQRIAQVMSEHIRARLGRPLTELPMQGFSEGARRQYEEFTRQYEPAPEGVFRREDIERLEQKHSGEAPSWAKEPLNVEPRIGESWNDVPVRDGLPPGGLTELRGGIAYSNLHPADPKAKLATPMPPEEKPLCCEAEKRRKLRQLGKIAPFVYYAHPRPNFVPRTPTPEEIEEIAKNFKRAAEFYRLHGRSLQYKPSLEVRIPKRDANVVAALQKDLSTNEPLHMTIVKNRRDPGDFTQEEIDEAMKAVESSDKIVSIDPRPAEDFEHVSTATFPDGSVLVNFRVKKRQPNLNGDVLPDPKDPK